MAECANCGGKHFIVRDVHTGYVLPKAKGGLVETSTLVCKNCGEPKDNRVAIPPEAGTLSPSGGIW